MTTRRNNSKLQIKARKHAERIIAKQDKRTKATPFETMFPPIKDRKLPKDGAAYL